MSLMNSWGSNNPRLTAAMTNYHHLTNKCNDMRNPPTQLVTDNIDTKNDALARTHT
eukprot:gene3281-8255_t